MPLRLVLVTALLLTANAVAQSSAPSTPAPQRDPARTEPGGAGQKDTLPPATKKAPVGPATPVIRISGCDTPAPAKKPAPECRTVVTRAQFESLVKALNPNMSPADRRAFARNYGRLLVVANEARRRGVHNQPETLLLFEFAKLQVVAQEFARQLQESAAKVPPTAVDSFYRDHQKDFEALGLQRVIVAKTVASKEKPVDEAAEKQYADKIRERWIAGEDPAKLQAEAYARTDSKAPPPAVDLGDRRRSGLPVTQHALFDMKVGDVSEPLADPSAFFIYKVLSKGPEPLDKVREEIRKTLAAQRLQTQMDKVTKSAVATVNDDYFAEPQQPEHPAVAPGPSGKAPEPPAKPVMPPANPSDAPSPH